MHLRFLLSILLLWTCSAFSAERDLFTRDDLKLLDYLKSSQFLFEKSLEERRDEAQRFFVFILGLDSKEDYVDLKKLNFGVFSKIEDEGMIKDSRDRFIEEMQRMEVQE